MKFKLEFLIKESGNNDFSLKKYIAKMNLSINTGDTSRLNTTQENSIVNESKILVDDGMDKEELIRYLEIFMSRAQTGSRTFPIIRKYIDELRK